MKEENKNYKCIECNSSLTEENTNCVKTNFEI